MVVLVALGVGTALRYATRDPDRDRRTPVPAGDRPLPPGTAGAWPSRQCGQAASPSARPVEQDEWVAEPGGSHPPGTARPACWACAGCASHDRRWPGRRSRPGCRATP